MIGSHNMQIIIVKTEMQEKCFKFKIKSHDLNINDSIHHCLLHVASQRGLGAKTTAKTALKL